jgi:valacyclovir hydrolase
MAWFDEGQAHIYYEESGSGDPVLLLPGWGGSIEELAPLRGRLARRFRVIAADLPGSGKSGPQPRTYTPSYWQEDADALVSLLAAAGASPAHLAGFSDGGEYGLLMAATRPGAVRSLVTWGAAGSLGNNVQMAEAMLNMVDNPIPPMQEFSNHMKAAYGEEGARTMTQSFGHTLLTVIQAGGDISRSRAGEITCPALLITGEHDFLAPPSLVRDMVNAMPNAQFVEAKGASHPVHVEQPDWLVDTVADWFEKR